MKLQLLKIYFCAEELKSKERKNAHSRRWYLSPPAIAEELPDFILAPATTNILSFVVKVHSPYKNKMGLAMNNNSKVWMRGDKGLSVMHGADFLIVKFWYSILNFGLSSVTTSSLWSCFSCIRMQSHSMGKRRGSDASSHSLKKVDCGVGPGRFSKLHDKLQKQGGEMCIWFLGWNALPLMERNICF